LVFAWGTSLAGGLLSCVRLFHSLMEMLTNLVVGRFLEEMRLLIKAIKS